MLFVRAEKINCHLKIRKIQGQSGFKVYFEDINFISQVNLVRQQLLVSTSAEAEKHTLKIAKFSRVEKSFEPS